MDNMSHCYCSMCRKTHGALFGTYISVPTAGFIWEQGKEHTRIYESSPGFRRAFCPTCGSVAPSDNTEGEYAVPVGGLEDDCEARPRSNIFADAKAPWYKITDDLPSYVGYYPGRFYCSFGGSGKRRCLTWGLAISFSMWQCAGHGNASGTGWRH